MTLIGCKKSSFGSPYVVEATNMVKDCSVYQTIELDKCRNCENYIDEHE
jgi:hypothetical protein